MGLYTDHIFPRLMDRALSGGPHPVLRTHALEEARGLVLEIGFGTGLNLPYYPPAVEKLVLMDSSRSLSARVRRRLRHSPVPVEVLQRDAAERMPFEDSTFDTVVSTWTLCSVEGLQTALAEIRRVLGPAGRFLFMEHGLSDQPATARIQNLLNPVQNVVSCGCNLNRRIDKELEAAGLVILSLERFVVPNVPRAFGEVYRGVARRGNGGSGT
jgi:ubiquinone/menaquinone biosynthesis C-methylase UbiE